MKNLSIILLLFPLFSEANLQKQNLKMKNTLLRDQMLGKYSHTIKSQLSRFTDRHIPYKSSGNELNVFYKKVTKVICEEYQNFVKSIPNMDCFKFTYWRVEKELSNKVTYYRDRDVKARQEAEQIKKEHMESVEKMRDTFGYTPKFDKRGLVKMNVQEMIDQAMFKATGETKHAKPKMHSDGKTIVIHNSHNGETIYW